MAGLARICKMFGRMTFTDNGRKLMYVWDCANNEAVPEDQMPVGSERWKASERAKYKVIADAKPK